MMILNLYPRRLSVSPATGEKLFGVSDHLELGGSIESRKVTETEVCDLTRNGISVALVCNRQRLSHQKPCRMKLGDPEDILEMLVQDVEETVCETPEEKQGSDGDEGPDCTDRWLEL